MKIKELFVDKLSTKYINKTYFSVMLKEEEVDGDFIEEGDSADNPEDRHQYIKWNIEPSFELNEEDEIDLIDKISTELANI